MGEGWGRVGLSYQYHGDPRREISINPVEANNLDIAQARLRIYSVTPYKEDHTRSKGICEIFI